METYFEVSEFSLIPGFAEATLVVQHSSSKHHRCLVFIFCGSILDNLGLCSRHCEIHPALVNELSYTKISIIASGVCQSTHSFV